MAHEPRWHNGGDPDIDPRLWWADCRCGWRYPEGHRGANRATVQQAVDHHERERA